MKLKFFSKMRFSGFFVLLTFILMLTASAQAETLSTLIENANDGDTVTLTTAYDNSIDSKTINKNISIDLNGQDNVTLSIIRADKSLTIKNGTLTCKIENGYSGYDCTLTLDGAKLNCQRVNGDNDANSLYWLAKNISLKNGSQLLIHNDDNYNGEVTFGSDFTLTLDDKSSVVLTDADLCSITLAVKS